MNLEELTEVASPFGLSQLRFHLITPNCSLWRADENVLRAQGLEEPFWGFVWGGGLALARYLLDHPDEVRGRTVFDFGAGCGIDAIAASAQGATRVVANDVDPNCRLAIQANASLNGVSVEADIADRIGTPVEAEVIVVGDMFYDTALGVEIASWLSGMARAGKRILIGDPGRNMMPRGSFTKLAEYPVPTDNDFYGHDLRTATVFSLDGSSS